MAIKVSNLDVKYKDIHAVKNVSFEVKDGEIFGMIGSNGAGKTTIIESIEGLRKKYDDSISVMGVDPKHERKKLYKTIGVQLQETSYQDKIRVKEIGKLFASFTRIQVTLTVFSEILWLCFSQSYFRRCCCLYSEKSMETIRFPCLTGVEPWMSRCRPISV